MKLRNHSNVICTCGEELSVSAWDASEDVIQVKPHACRFKQAPDKMSASVFDQLQNELQRTHDQHEALQKLYNEQTGRRWVCPLRLKGWPKREAKPCP